MKILLTGSTGFIGKNLKEAWRHKYDLYCPGRKELDLLDLAAVEDYLRQHRFDVVIHAANTNDVTYRLEAYDILDQNLRMFYHLEKNNGLYGKMYYFGSGAEYDRKRMEPLVKEEKFGENIPGDPYGFAKYTMSKIAGASENIYDLRLFGVYGRYEQWQRRFISNAICRSLKGMPITIGQNVYFDYLYIDDLTNIMEWFLEHEPVHHHYNVCTGKRVDLKSLAGMVNEATGLKRDILIAREGLAREYSGSNARLLRELGAYEFKKPDTGIEVLFAYYKAVIEEIEEGLLK